MRGPKGLLPLLLVGVAGLAWLLFLSEPSSRWLTGFLVAPPSQPPAVGLILNSEGAVKRVHDGDATDVAEGDELRDGDRLEAGLKTHVRVRLNSNDEFDLAPGSSASFTLWNPLDPQSPVYATILNGDLRFAKAGRHGRAYVVREGRLYLPEQKSDVKPPGLRVTRQELKDLKLPEEIPETPDTAEDSEAVAPVTGQNAKVVGAGEPKTLSNEYIDATILEHQPQLQKCWLPRLKKNPDLRGALTVQFEINRRGRVRDAKVADRTLADSDLERCVIAVFDRIQFRPFQGAEISLTYPITFE